MQPQCVSSGSVNSELRFVFQAFHYFEVIAMQVLLNPGRYHPAFISILYSVSWLHPLSVMLGRLAHAATYMYRQVLYTGHRQPTFISLYSVSWLHPMYVMLDTVAHAPTYLYRQVLFNAGNHQPTFISILYSVSWLHPLYVMLDRLAQAHTYMYRQVLHTGHH